MSAVVLAAALEWQAAGASVIRARSDGSKAPLGTWKKYQQAAPTDGEIRAWFGNGSAPDGLGLVCGAVSGSLDMFEFEGRAVADGLLLEYCRLLGERGLLALWQRVTAGYAEATPSGGVHVLYRIAGPVPGNTKLARRPATPDELAANPDDKIKTLIETRGEGGFVVIAPSGGPVHPTGRSWALLSGGPRTVVTITPGEREALCDVARLLDQMPMRTSVSREGVAHGTNGQHRPVQTTSAAWASWAAILEPHGWVCIGDDANGDQLWRRPGKDEGGHSATTHDNGGLYVWSTSTDFGDVAEIPLSKAAVSAVLNDGMDAAGALAAYGNAQEAADAAETAWQDGMLAVVGAPADWVPDPGPWQWAGEALPRFRVENAAIAGRELRAKLGTGALAGLFLRSGVLVHTPRTGEDGYVMPTAEEIARGIDHGPAQVQPVDVAHARSLIEVRFDVGKIVKEKNGTERWSPVLFPADAARSAVGAAELGIGCPNLKRLDGITHTPVMRSDGTVLDAPGYDASTRLLYLPTGGLDVPPIPEQPSAAQIRAAVALLREPIALFPWVAEHHEANYLGAMFTPLLLLLLPSPYQFVLITATNSGSGKGFLLRLLGIVHGIVMRGEFPREREELRKMIFSTLLTTTAPIIGFDNIRGTIYSSELEALLTTRMLNERVLGASRNADVTNDRLWAATGNNARIGGDLPRRVLPVALDPQCANPYKRTFAFNPVEWMTARRGEYIAALLTVARGWIAAGRPEADAGRSDDYRQWYAATRGLLGWAGIPGTFGAEDKNDLSAVSEDDAEWARFVAELRRVFDDESFTTADIIRHLDRAIAVPPVPERPSVSEFLAGPNVPPGVRINPDALPGELAEKWERVGYGKTTGFTKTLGKWLSYRDGRFTEDGICVRMLAGRKTERVSRFRIDGEYVTA